jgi:hypothetical protein
MMSMRSSQERALLSGTSQLCVSLVLSVYSTCWTHSHSIGVDVSTQQVCAAQGMYTLGVQAADVHTGCTPVSVDLTCCLRASILRRVATDWLRWARVVMIWVMGCRGPRASDMTLGKEQRHPHDGTMP